MLGAVALGRITSPPSGNVTSVTTFCSIGTTVPFSCTKYASAAERDHPNLRTRQSAAAPTASESDAYRGGIRMKTVVHGGFTLTAGLVVALTSACTAQSVAEQPSAAASAT